MDNVICYTGYGEVSDNTDYQEYQIGCIGCAEKSITIPDDLLNIDLEHVLLNLSDDGSENIGYRKP